MRTAPLPALLLLPVLAAAAPASPSTLHFRPLITEIFAREAALPESGLSREQKVEARAIKKSFRALGLPSADIAGDLRIATKMAAALDAGYPGDPTVDGLLEGLLAALGGEVDDDRDELAVGLDTLAASRLRDRAVGKLGRADALLALAGSEPVRKRRARFLLKAEKQIVRGAALAARADPAPPGVSVMTAVVGGRPWRTNGDFGTAVSGTFDVSGSTGGLRRISMTGWEILPRTGSDPDKPLPGESRRLQITVSSFGPDLGPGTYTVGNSGGVSVSVLWIHEDEEGAAATFVGTSGSITIATLAPPATGTATGTFGFTILDGATGQTLGVASGTFSVKNLPSVAVP